MGIVQLCSALKTDISIEKYMTFYSVTVAGRITYRTWTHKVFEHTLERTIDHPARRAVNSKQHCCSIVSCSKQLCCWTLILMLYRVHDTRTYTILILRTILQHSIYFDPHDKTWRKCYFEVHIIPGNAEAKTMNTLGPPVGVHNSSAVNSRCPDEFQPLVPKR